MSSNQRLMCLGTGAAVVLAATVDLVRIRDASQMSIMFTHHRLIASLIIDPARLRHSSHAFVSASWPRLIATVAFVVGYASYLMWYCKSSRPAAEASNFWSVLRPGIPLLIAAAMASPFSTDTLQYLHYGSMVLAKVNPYLHLPDALQTPYLTYLVWPQTSPYGPVALTAYAFVAALARGNPLIGLGIFKLLFMGLHLAAAMFCWNLSESSRTRRTQAYLYNPLLLMSLIVDAHMDAIAIAFLVAAFCALSRGRGLLALVLLMLACLTKAVLVVALPFLFAWFFVRRDSRSIAMGFAALCATVVALSCSALPTLDAWRSLTYLLPHTGRSIQHGLILLGGWLGTDLSVLARYYEKLATVALICIGLSIWIRRLRADFYDTSCLTRDCAIVLLFATLFVFPYVPWWYSGPVVCAVLWDGSKNWLVPPVLTLGVCTAYTLEVGTGGGVNGFIASILGIVPTVAVAIWSWRGGPINGTDRC